MASIPTSAKTAMGHQLEDLLLSCEYSGYSCNASDFEHFYNNVHGNCFIFNSGWGNVTVENSHKPGPQYGLTLVLNVEQDDYIGDLAESAGVRIVVHSQDKMPFPEDEGVSVSPGQLTSLGLSMVKLERKGGRFGDCIDSKNLNEDKNVYEEHFNVKYSTTACYKTCLQTWIIKRCQCADPQIPITGKALDEAWSAWPSLNKTVCNTVNETISNCKASVETDYSSGSLSCTCPNQCSESTFKTTVSSNMWPSDKHKVDLYKNLKELNNSAKKIIDDSDNTKVTRNFLKVTVFYKEFNFESIIESEKYSFIQFISDIGGVLGLYLGCSLLTVLEFIELILDLMIILCAKACSRQTTVQRLSNNVESSGTSSNAVGPMLISPPPPYSGKKNTPPIDVKMHEYDL